MRDKILVKHQKNTATLLHGNRNSDGPGVPPTYRPPENKNAYSFCRYPWTSCGSTAEGPADLGAGCAPGVHPAGDQEKRADVLRRFSGPCASVLPYRKEGLSKHSTDTAWIFRHDFL